MSIMKVADKRVEIDFVEGDHLQTIPHGIVGSLTIPHGIVRRLVYL